MTTDRTEALVMAYVDGALVEADRSAFEQRLAADPALAARVAGHRWLAYQIAAAYGPPPEGALSSELLALLEPPAAAALPPIRGVVAERRSASRPRSKRLALPAAIAASLVLGLWIGGARGPATPGWTLWQDGRLLAANDLASALTRQEAGQPGLVRIGMTFRTGQGPCRTFSTPGGTSGLACRQDGTWILPVIVSGPAGAPAPGEYRLAGGEVAPAVMTEVDRRISGSPLTRAEERALRERHWQGQ